jgi:multidrug resistance efflux pump
MRRRLPLLRPVLILGAALLVAIALLLLFVRIDRVIVAKGHLTGGTVAVYAPWDGRVARVLVKPGDEVAAGQLLVQMEPDPLQAEALQTETRIEVLTQQLQNLQREKTHLISEVHPAELEQASRELERARLELTSAEKRFELTKQLRDKGLTTKLEFEEAELKLELAQLALKEAEQAPPVLRSNQRARIEEKNGVIQAIEGQIEEERAGHNELQRKLALSSLTAAADGTVLGARLFELEGQTVHEGDELLRLSTGKTERFEGVIFDTGRALTRPGLAVKIRLEGYPWLIHGTLSGRLDFVADRCASEGGFPVKISFDPSTAPGSLYEGMKGEARIMVEEKVSLGRMLVEKFVGTH